MRPRPVHTDSPAGIIARNRYAREARGEGTPGFYPHNPPWTELDDYHRSLYIKDAEDDLKALERRAANATDVGALR